MRGLAADMQNPILGPLSRPSADMVNRSLDQLEARVRSVGSSSSRHGKEELKRVAHEFESLFVSYLLKVMRETIEESTGEQGYGKTIYTELFDDELSRTIAKQGTFGIADLLIQRLSQVEEPGVGTSLPAIPQTAPQKAPSAPASPASGVSPESESIIPDIHLPVRALVSSEFGMRRDPFTRQLRFHKGLDLAAPSGTEVRVALGGEVVFAGFKTDYGNTVVVQHPGGLETTYAHLGEVSVKKGESIAADQVLGIVGSTGHSTGPHLHYEVTRWREPVDPRSALTE